jgi:hypothetical protein
MEDTVKLNIWHLKQMVFVQAFEELQADAFNINTQSGFNTDDLLLDEFEEYVQGQSPEIYQKFAGLFPSFRNARVGLKLMLTTSELSEALESVRKNLGPDSHIPEFSSEEAEVADAIIRLMNYATDRNLRLAEAIVAKNEFNRNRRDHSKEGRAETHGKKF